uniref:Metallo-beta-lactamase domain-containing protein 1 n=1 Tax=Parastrongyloides trichosuri TaxID=131310 RepID=A0A0N4ZWV8_PARTI
MTTITQIIDGYVREDNSSTTKASGSVILIERFNKILLFDCGDPWNEKELKENLMKKRKLKIEDITDIIISHWHIDHIGNLGIFPDNKLQRNWEQFKDIENVMNIKINSVKECHSNEDVYIIASNNDGTTLISGDIFENENDIWNEENWCCQSKNVIHQKLQRYLLSKNVDFIIPGHGSIFKITDRHKEKLYCDIFKNCDLLKIFTTDDDIKKCYIKGPNYNVVLNNWFFEDQNIYENITHLIITHNHQEYFVNIKKFTNAQIIMDNDISMKDSCFPNDLVSLL